MRGRVGRIMNIDKLKLLWKAVEEYPDHKFDYNSHCNCAIDPAVKAGLVSPDVYDPCGHRHIGNPWDYHLKDAFGLDKTQVYYLFNNNRDVHPDAAQGEAGKQTFFLRLKQILDGWRD